MPKPHTLQEALNTSVQAHKLYAHTQQKHAPACACSWSCSGSICSVVQEPHAQRNDQGFYQLPTTTKAVTLSLSSFTLATAAVSAMATPGLDSDPGQLQWVCQ